MRSPYVDHVQLDTDGSGEIDYEEYMRFVLKETLQRKARVTMCVPSSMLSRCHLPAASRYPVDTQQFARYPLTPTVS